MIIYNVKEDESKKTLKNINQKTIHDISQKDVDVFASTSKQYKLTRNNQKFLKSLGFELKK